MNQEGLGLLMIFNTYNLYHLNAMEVYRFTDNLLMVYDHGPLDIHVLLIKNLLVSMII